MATGLNSKETIENLFNSIIENQNDERIILAFEGLLIHAPRVFRQYEIISDYIYHLEIKQYEKIEEYFRDHKDFSTPSFGKVRLQLSNIIKLNNLRGSTETLDKFERHVKLACSQRGFILDNARKANEEAEKAKKVAESAMDIKTKIYSEFIAILGIFTAISFMSMGSLQVLGDVFKDVNNPSSASVGYAMIVGGLYIAVMYVFVVVMFVGMKKVVGNGENYNFSLGICALVLIIVFSLIGLGLLISSHIITGSILIIVCASGLLFSYLNIQNVKKLDNKINK